LPARAIGKFVLCSAGGAHPNYRLPYELELGHSPSMEEMQDYVVEQKKRPVLEDAWRQHKVLFVGFLELD